jgi:BASS family bile acid:Na+ symporter
MTEKRFPATLWQLGKVYGRTIAFILAIGAGILVPQAHTLAFLVPYLIALLLFFSFLDVSITPRSFERRVYSVLLANVGIAFAGYFVLAPVNGELALAAFFTGVSPTAISAPVIIGLLEGRVEYVVASVLLTNVFTAMMIPFVLPLVAGTHAVVSTWEILQSVLLVVIVPLVSARLVGHLPEKTQATLRIGKSYCFSALVAAIFLTTSKAAFFIYHEVSVPTVMLVEIAIISLIICTVNFVVGAFLGGKNLRRETSQSLGQKNNSFTIWLALTFVNPLVALGPTFYVVYHNLYNSFQLYALEKRRTNRMTPARTD